MRATATGVSESIALPLLPITVTARQARRLERQDDSHATESDVSQQAFEPATVLVARGGLTQVVIDDTLLRDGPAQRYGAFRQGSLPALALLMMHELVNRRLPHIDVGDLGALAWGALDERPTYALENQST